MVRRTVVPVMCHQRLLRTVCWTEILHQISSIHWRRRSIRRLRVSIRSSSGLWTAAGILKTQISISDKSYAGIDVKLKDYLIYLSVGDAFDPNAYFDSADKEGELTVQSNVNTAKAGS